MRILLKNAKDNPCYSLTRFDSDNFTNLLEYPASKANKARRDVSNDPPLEVGVGYFLDISS